MHNNLLATRHVTQHCAWVQCIYAVEQNLFGTPLPLGICVNGFLFGPLHAFDKRPGSAPWQLLISAFCRPPTLGCTTPGRLFVSAYPAGDISLRFSPATLLFKFPTPCKTFAWPTGIPERVWHWGCCNTPANRDTFSSPAAGTLADSPCTLRRTIQTRFAVLKCGKPGKASLSTESSYSCSSHDFESLAPYVFTHAS